MSWLANEAYRRRQILTSSAYAATLDGASRVRLSTRDGALLLPTDRLLSVIPGWNQSDSTMELLAELVGEPPGPPPMPSVTPGMVNSLPITRAASPGNLQIGGNLFYPTFVIVVSYD